MRCTCLWSAVPFVAAFLLSSASSQAAPVQFATFSLVTANQPVAFTNNGGTSGTIRVTNAPVVFDFTAASGLSTGDHQATLNLSGTTFTPASSNGQITQPITNNSTLSLIENGTGKNLLTLQFTGNIVGSFGGTNATLSGTDTSGQFVTYSSDFGTFTPPGNSYNLTLANLTPTLSIGPGGFVNSFISNLSGTFTANFTPNPTAAVPEPGSVALLIGLTTTGAGFLSRRRSRRIAA